jgi:hypothetical protein
MHGNDEMAVFTNNSMNADDVSCIFPVDQNECYYAFSPINQHP